MSSIDKVFTSEETKLYRFYGPLMHWSGPYYDFAHWEPVIVPVKRGSGEVIGAAQVVCNPTVGMLFAECAIDYQSEERFDIESDNRKYYLWPQGYMDYSRLTNIPVDFNPYGPPVVTGIRLKSVVIDTEPKAHAYPVTPSKEN